MGRWRAYLQPSRVVVGLLAATLFAAGPAFADDAAWTGTGPFPPGNGSDRINALLLDSATGVLYAGAGSGTVFALSDSSLSQPPVALDDSVATYENTAVTIDILDNDFDPEGALDTGSVVIESHAANGTVNANADATATYTPASGFIGADSFSYAVRDAAGAESNVATAVVNVQAEPADDDSGGDNDNGSGNGGTAGSAGGGIGGATNTGTGGGNAGITPPPAASGGGSWGLFGWLLMLPAWLRRRLPRRKLPGEESWPPRR